MNSLKKGEGVPLINFEGGPAVLPLNFEGGPGIPLLNFRGVPGPTFKLWGGSWVPRSWVLGSWFHFYTMPFLNKVAGLTLKKETLAQVFSCEFCEISKNIFFHRTPLVAVSYLWNNQLKLMLWLLIRCEFRKIH